MNIISPTQYKKGKHRGATRNHNVLPMFWRIRLAFDDFTYRINEWVDDNLFSFCSLIIIFTLVACSSIFAAAAYSWGAPV